MSSVVRLPSEVLAEAKQIAALRGQQPGDVLAAAWREYLVKHREDFASDFEEAARLLRDGTLDQLADHASRNARARAEAAVERSPAGD